MSAFKDITGERFGKLMVIRRGKSDKFRKVRWICGCDCGNETLIRRSHLISGETKSCGCLRHMSLSEDHREKISEAAIKRWSNPIFKDRMSGDGCSEETRKKHAKAMEYLWEKPEYRKKMSDIARRNWNNKEYRNLQIKRLSTFRHSVISRKKIGDRHRGKVISEESKRLCSLANKGKRYSPETEFTSSSLKKKYQDPIYVKKMAKAWGIKPNKPESFIINLLNELYPNEWKYTGDFSFTINGKCPDFVNCNGQKKIIELFGDYWHRGQDPQDRINTFKPFGYETLVIWEHELKNMNSTIEKIRKFVEINDG